MRHAVIDETTHKVKNVIIWDGKSNWKPPMGHYLVQHDKCDIGDQYNQATKSFKKFYEL